MSTKTKNILIWVIAGILAFIFAFVGIEKLLGSQDQIKNFEEWHLPLWYRFPVGIIEIIIAVGLLWPFFRKLTIYGIFVWAIAAAALHIHAGEYLLATLPILLGAIAAIILFLILKTRVKQ